MRAWESRYGTRNRFLTVSSASATPALAQCQELVWACISVMLLLRRMEDASGLIARCARVQHFLSVYRVRRKRIYQWWCFHMENEVFDQRDMTILIVDDEPRIRDFVRM